MSKRFVVCIQGQVPTEVALTQEIEAAGASDDDDDDDNDVGGPDDVTEIEVQQSTADLTQTLQHEQHVQVRKYSLTEITSTTCTGKKILRARDRCTTVYYCQPHTDTPT